MRREYHASRPRVAALVITLLVFVVLGALMWADAGLRSLELAEDPGSEVTRVAALSMIVLFLVPLLALAPILVRRAPLLVIDDEGLIESGTALGMAMGRIRFTDMVRVRVLSVGLDFVGIDLVSVDEFLRDAPVLRRAVVRVNLLTRYPPITILVAPMGVRADDLVAEILRAKAAAAQAAGEEGPYSTATS